MQAILLLVWYSLLNPDKGSIWFLVGLASRTCVDLGFHNEQNSQIDQLDALELDMRRRLFWCTYKMDRLLSNALGRPPSMPDGFICVSVSIASPFEWIILIVVATMCPPRRRYSRRSVRTSIRRDMFVQISLLAYHEITPTTV